MSKKLYLSAEQLQPLSVGLGTCIATDKVAVQGLPVRFMYREQPVNQADSGWRFLSGLESDAYMENANNQGAYDVNLIANIDPSVIPHLQAAAGAAFEKASGVGDFQEAGDWEPDED
ncbi:MAG: DUF2185 domain-containing protein [Aquabacterium sp.]|nr:DUF2185 domain-containing protein [Aquabacterium sp.]